MRPSCSAGGLAPLRRRSPVGEGEERVVERRLAERGLLDRDAGVLERVERRAQVAAGPSGAATVKPARAHVELGVEPLEHAAPRPANASASGSVRCTRRSPTRAFSSAGVPAATVRPSESTTIWSARRSASSRYWVVSTSATPSATRPSTAPHMSWRLAGSRPVVGSSRKTTGRVHDQAGGEVEPPAHAAGVGADLAVGGVGDAEALEQLARRARRRRALESCWRRPSSIRFSRPVRRSSSEACWPASDDLLAHGAGRGGDVVAGDERAALRRCEQGGEDADGGRLARAVVAEQAEHGAGLDGEVEARAGRRSRRSACRGPR